MVKTIFVLFLLVSVNCFAATFYVDSNATNDSGSGAIDSPKKYITSGVLLMSGGDTLIIKDGIYTGQNNMIGDYANPQIYLPSGSPGNFTTIKAEHVGQAVIDAKYLRPAFSHGAGPTYRNYIHVDGIHFRHGLGGVFSIAGNHNWISNCGFEDGQPYTDDTESPVAFIAGNSTYNLIEDCWVWGKGRYGFYTSNPHSTGSANNIFRRLVVRLDAVPSGWMSSGLRFYSAHDGAMQNSIVIDSLTGSNSGANGTCSECWSFAQGGGSSAGEWGHVFNSNIALNNPNRPAFTNEAGNSNAAESWSNSIWWDVPNGMLVYAGLNTVNTWNISNMLIGGSASPSKINSNGFTYGASRNEVINLSDSIIVNLAGSAFGGAGNFLKRNINNVNVYNNGSSVCNSADGCTASGVTTINPFASVIKYLPRIESGTQGATVMYQVGGTGTFYGEEGWNTTSSNQLWPYPNEAIWAAKLKAYSVNTISGNRGFAALSGSTATPLTDYIWGYLGHVIPPFNVRVSSGLPNSALLLWNSNTSNVNISGYKVYVGTSTGVYDVPGYEIGKNVGNVTSVTLTNLPSGTLYFAVTAVDSIKGESGYSYEAQYISPDGDVNGDNVIDFFDVIKAISIALGVDVPTSEQRLHMDVAPLNMATHLPQPDGVIDNSDVILILRKALDLPW